MWIIDGLSDRGRSRCCGLPCPYPLDEVSDSKLKKKTVQLCNEGYSVVNV